MVNKQLFPYKEFEDHPAWSVVSKALIELECNGDLQLSTLPQYVIGLIMKRLSDSGMIAKPEAVS